MQIFSLRAKLVVLVRGVKMKLERRLVDRRLLFFDELGEPTKLTEAEFYSGYEKREIEVCPDQPFIGEIPHVRNAPPDLSCFPARHSKEALRRRAYLEGVREEGESKLPSEEIMLDKLKEIARRAGDSCVPSISTIRRWASKYMGKDVLKLLPKHSKKGRTASIAGELKDILDEVIDELYLNETAVSVSKVIGELDLRIKESNLGRLPSNQLAMPSGMTIRRYIANLDPYLVDEAQLGKHAAKKKHRAATGVLRINHILERWEIDHTLLDLLLVDEETGLVIGRPYMTVVVDKFSRMVMGYLLHLAAPNTESVLRVIERAIRPKADLLRRFPNVKNEWRAHGMPTRIAPDNAAEFHAGDLVIGFNDLGIEILYPASRAPEEKGTVERFFSTQNLGLIHNLPGTTFSNVQQRGDYDSEQHACFTLVQLEAAVVKWIVDGYHQTPHRGLNKKTPAQVWLNDEQQHLIRLPVDLDALECILARRCAVKVHHYGIEVDTIGYHSSELAQLRMRLKPGEKVSVRYRDEAGHVWVHDRFRSVFLQVPVKDKRMIGKSRELWKAAQKALREAGRETPSFDELHRTYREIREEIDEAKTSQKLRRRREAARAKLDREGRKVDTNSSPVVVAEVDWVDSQALPTVAPLKVSYRPPSVGGRP
ncbi:Transposon Tn7 transposition protein TnsB [Pseudomonas sp. 24 E 13]|nr:Transposon Tn7 transposition protein TnsB [Pseudomonas sp. 24 E 13]